MRRVAICLSAVAVLSSGCAEPVVDSPGPAPTTANYLQLYQDRAAMSDLRNAVATAKVYYTDDDSYARFDAFNAHEIEPSLTWTDEGTIPSGEGTVDISGVTANEVVMLADSAAGSAFCIADNVTKLPETVHGILAGQPVTTFAACDALEDW